MKKIAIIIIGILISVSTNAQEKNLSFMIGVGVSYPTSPTEFKSSWKNGFTFTGAGYYRLSEHLSSGLHLGYHYFGLENEKYYTDIMVIETSGGEITVFTAMPGIMHTFTDGRISPFLELGLGIFYLQRERSNSSGFIHIITTPDDEYTIVVESDSYSETKFGFRIGGGIEIKSMFGKSILLDISYTVGSTNSESSEFLLTGLRIKF